MRQPRQLRLVDILIFIGMCSALFALIRFVGFWSAMMLTMIPYSFIGERLLTRNIADVPLYHSPSTAERLRGITFMLCVLVGVVAWVSVSTGVPSYVAPFPFLTILLALYGLGFLGAGIFVGIVAIMVQWSFLRGQPPQNIPFRYPIFVGMSTVNSVWWFISGWDGGIRYQGRDHMLYAAVMNTIFIVSLWGIWFGTSRSRAPWGQLVFRTLLLAWLFWCAYPWRGELL